MADKNSSAWHVERIMLDADTARRLLEGNRNNRPVSQGTVLRYAVDILEGRWVLGNDIIMVGEDGQLHNGQHRCEAVLLAAEDHPEVAIPVMIRRNVPRVEFDHIDQGRLRTGAHILAMHDVVNANVVNSLAKIIMMYDRMPKVIWNGKAQVHHGITRDSIVEWVLKHQDDLAVALVHPKPPMVKTHLSAFRYLVARDSAHADYLDEWTDGLVTGANLTSGDPRLALRSHLINRTPSWGANRQSYLGVHIAAWNRSVQGKDWRVARFMRTQLPMPEVV